MIEFKNVGKRDKNRQLFEKLNLRIDKGEVVGIYGKPGSGKTLILDMIIGLQRPSTGEVLIDGLDVASNILEIRKKIGYMSNPTIYKTFTVREFFQSLAKTKGLEGEESIDRIIDIFELRDIVDKKISSLDTKTIKILSISSAYLAQPEIILLDDPFIGVEDTVRDNLIASIQKAKGKYTTVIASQSAEVLERLCKKVIVLQEGQIQENVMTEDLKKNNTKLEDMIN